MVFRHLQIKHSDTWINLQSKKDPLFLCMSWFMLSYQKKKKKKRPVHTLSLLDVCPAWSTAMLPCRDSGSHGDLCHKSFMVPTLPNKSKCLPWYSRPHVTWLVPHPHDLLWTLLTLSPYCFSSQLSSSRWVSPLHLLSPLIASPRMAAQLFPLFSQPSSNVSFSRCCPWPLCLKLYLIP